ncbi:aromatic-ring-hydroxylating dioxygenase subunit beta [Halobellus sp. GM3]|uniref:aromatic-ring-hydroxylating dioxygenase subunit beta n=1 Tax=Halobellus sp. GM3 TaxID=3458410 RepID=UPI00403DB01F
MTAEYERHYQCVQFYNREAELLDSREFEEWVDLLSDDINYEMPVRNTKEIGADADEFSDQTYYYCENKARLEKRAERFHTEYAWSEDPPSLTRRFVTNVRIEEADDEVIETRNNLLVYRSMGGDRRPVYLISAERRDTLIEDGDELLLDDRQILLDDPSVKERLSLFL